MTDLVLVPPLPPGRADDDEPPGLVRLDSPVGRIEIVSRHFAVEGLAIEREGVLPHDGQPERPDNLLDAARRQVDGYFEGVRTRFDLPLRLVGSSFQRSVWSALLEVEWGRATTYGRLGGTFGNPRAGRAVGGAVAVNPLPLLVPCHRVLGRTGGVTGYTVGTGVETKKWLLRHEGIAFREGPVPLD
ncbi:MULTISPECIES: methylated-DNA--[protein]-cysteine S-methyltransferase [unclassified Frigoribacterium]|uniref:methylated-DNA--[protein]-cysteine S-methyltransferase n=1 Tax=unclassified Frigoribacterium TaxID=2627005 RepID=UPI00177E4602|nr:MULTISPECIES: methylated-DNA--[protein]-cysteine S-methyltransferase [unclassified Frigoribacterium]MBD8485331.1 methylated-DNA--[protein]-cysteine S-methyltransferase [Frigoribacterium sp. CFBP 8759]WAC50765.1 methylated-DNA--[protein]-cysteine S-methyltransferase [Frigoribacterium sp. SL97]